MCVEKLLLITFCILSTTSSPPIIADKWSFSSITGMFFCSAGGQESQLDFEFDASVSVLTLRKPGVNAGEDWTIMLK